MEQEKKKTIRTNVKKSVLGAAAGTVLGAVGATTVANAANVEDKLDEQQIVSSDDMETVQVLKPSGVQHSVNAGTASQSISGTQEPESILEPIEEPISEPVDEPILEPVEEPVDEPILEPVEEPVEDPILEPIEGPIEGPVLEPTEEPFLEPTGSISGSQELDALETPVDNMFEVEVLGTELIEGDGNEAYMSATMLNVNGEDVALIDVDADGYADVMMMESDDSNGLLVDVTEDQISVDILQQDVDSSDSMNYDTPDYTNDANVDEFMF